MGSARNYSRRSKTSAASNKAIISKKPTAATQQKQILALNQKVNDNSRKLSGVRYKVVHKTRLAMNITAASTAVPYRVLSLNAPSLMSQIFSAPNEAEGGKYNWDNKGRTHLQFNIVSNNEPTPLPIQIFLVSAKNSKVALECGLNSQPPTFTLQSDRDFVNNIGAATFLNLKRFNVHKHWSINLSPVQTMQTGPAAVWQGDLHPIHRKHSMRQLLKLNNRTGVWSNTPDNGVNPSQRLFMLVFNNNISQPESYPILNGMVIHTAFTSE